MSFESQVSEVDFAGDGVTTVFPLANEQGALFFMSGADIRAALVAADGAGTELVNGTDFTVTGDGRTGQGSLTMNIAPADGVTLKAWCNTAIVQPEHYQENDAFPAATHETAQDRHVMMVRDAYRRASLGFSVPDFETAPARVASVADRANKLTAWDDQGGLSYSAKTLAELEAGALTSPAGIVSTVGDLRGLEMSAGMVGQIVYCRGCLAAGDGGGGFFYVRSDSPGVDDGGINVDSDLAGYYFERIHNGIINALWYCGRTGDVGVAVGKAVAYALARTGARIVVPPGGPYTWANQIAFTIPGSFAHKMILDLRGASITAPAAGYGLEITKTGPDPGYGRKNPQILGGYWIGNGTANGGVHLIDCTNAETYGVEGAGFTNMPGGVPSALMGCVIRQTVDAIQCELASHHRAFGTDCSALMVFDRTAAAALAGKDSHLRTTIRGPFFANGSGPSAGTWFYFGDGIDFGNCEISQVEGNWVSNSMFYVGAGARMPGTRIVGINAEANDPAHNKGLFLLSDYPNVGGASRPKVSGIGLQVLAAGSGATYPVWMKSDFAEVLPEPDLIQPFDMYGAQISGPTVRTGRYQNPNGIGDPDSVPARDATVAVNLVPGAAAVAILPPGIENGGIHGGAVQVRVWGKNGYAALIANACKAAESEAATITNAVSVPDTGGRALTLSWVGTGVLSIALSGAGGPFVYTVDISGVFT